MAADEGHSDSWWLKAAVAALFSFVAAVSVKGCDNWTTTNDVLSWLDERAKAREIWDHHQDERMQRVEQSLETMSANIEGRAAHARETIEELQRQVRRLEGPDRGR